MISILWTAIVLFFAWYALKNHNKRILKMENKISQLEWDLKTKQDKIPLNIGGKHEFGHDYD